MNVELDQRFHLPDMEWELCELVRGQIQYTQTQSAQFRRELIKEVLSQVQYPQHFQKSNVSRDCFEVVVTEILKMFCFC